ncbi:extracellular solute-binding protein [Jannaschia aquimarina]|uniref:Bacterial extracellular solute-binding protein, family 5 n=1 Tax=Jannaschia aquimarina TaxID=935700 RepID=A0A0D1D977_9RHOB|nr:extracellular solute-binding protein [Jannaschia aquimarina]KIT16453.1 Bacterial extracellular solute-binding protein, family 5 [Jannaschia aquimarina]SNS92730.1 microcin C transport system substrate-binding protein [Jannaschia aquimarina]
MRIRKLAPIALAAMTAPALAQDVTVSHGISNFGELKYGPDEPFAYVNVDAPKGGEISLHSIGNFDSFNPYTRNGNVAAGTAALWENLFISAADDPYGLYCYLCETIEYPEDLAFIRINLRPEIRFWDGTPMTAEDMKFTIDMFLQDGIAEFRNVFTRYYESIEVTGEHQLTVTFTDVAPKRDRAGLIGFWTPFSKAWFEETGASITETTLEPFMGTGPYMVGDFDTGRTMIYERTPDWWGADLALNQGRHNFDRIRYEYFGDASAAIQAFFAGEYTFRVESSSREWATSYDGVRPVQRGDIIRETLPDGAISNAQGFVFNLKRDKWSDPRVRQAISMMFNFEWSNETLFYGLYSRPNSFWGGSDLAAEGVPGSEEAAILQPLVDEGLLDASILTDEAWTAPVNDVSRSQPDRRARRTALGLMAEAGWELDADGLLRNEAGQTLDLVIIQFNPTFDRIINPFVENLREIGVNARLDRIDRAQYINRRRSGDWDLTNHSPGQEWEPGAGLKQWFHSETAEDSSRNLMALADPAIDSLIDTVIEAEDIDSLRASTRALDRALRSYGFWIPQWGNSEHWVAYWDQYERPEEIPPLALGVLDFWWYDAEAAEQLRASGAL